LNKIDKIRFKLIEAAERGAIKLFKRIENKFLRELLEELENILTISDNVVEATTANIVNLHKLGFFVDKFRKKNAPSIVKWFARKFITLAKINATYFTDYDLKDAEKRITKEVLKEYGVKIGDKGVSVTKYSFLDQITKYDDVYEGVRAAASNAISQGMDIQSFKKMIKETVQPDGKYGKIVNNFYTKANDTFSRFDRNVQHKYAVKLDLRAFLYSGGTVKSSRDFCRERNAKVFTIEEGEAWRNLEWQGKNKNYNPEQDMGGHNCRHFRRYLGKKEAIRRRPDLESYFENLEDA